MWVSGVIGGISGALVLGCCLIFYRMKNKYNDKGTHNAADSSQIGFLDISPEMRNRIHNLCHSSKMEIARNKFGVGSLLIIFLTNGNFESRVFSDMCLILSMPVATQQDQIDTIMQP